MDKTDRDFVWARWVREKRKAAQMTRRELARISGIDSSYVTLIERDGYVPRRCRVARIGQAFGCPNEAIIIAGMIPLEARSEISAFLRGAPPKRIPIDIAPLMHDLSQAPAKVRKLAVAVLGPLLQTSRNDQRTS